ncbi:hypothetical protein, partial [Acidovorax sp. SRB_24]|uniref:hypothetical protein n=1 Tax=Acidovorax sp. SRB_24 TaxID=1962700 RepID=UPI00145CEF58
GRLIAEGKIKRDKPLVEIGEEEKAFELLQGGVGGDLAMYQSTAMASAFLCADLRQRLAERQSVEARLAEALVQEVA